MIGYGTQPVEEFTHLLQESECAYVLPADHSVVCDRVKGHCLERLDQLQGWCSPTKASIMMDFVFMTKPRKVVEIGVYGGKSLIPMAFALKALGEGRIYGIDPWLADASAEGMEDRNLDWWSSLDHNAIYRGFMEKVKEFGLEKQVRVLRYTSEEAPPIGNIDILHIDGNHSEKASMIDVIKWVPLVRSGGLIIFDDITWGSNNKAVEWVESHCVKLAAYRDTGNDWGVWVKP